MRGRMCSPAKRCRSHRIARVIEDAGPYDAKKLPADSAGSAGMLTLDYTRVFKTSCSGTGASMGRGAPSTHWMAFFGHLETQVPQPLHLV